ncbi:hypothetical protein PHPALM_30509 [Phytophthora palmivora]|uniref:Uncharacterized protein n=1 Tax=Phytophthora palmivora TaxID=4796 RepID=A0A2P4X4Z5_9STRA|nr:hypothetical protein PHPALM_30509 [Phytophthora palmivora]
MCSKHEVHAVNVIRARGLPRGQLPIYPFAITRDATPRLRLEPGTCNNEENIVKPRMYGEHY